VFGWFFAIVSAVWALEFEVLWLRLDDLTISDCDLNLIVALFFAHVAGVRTFAIVSAFKLEHCKLASMEHLADSVFGVACAFGEYADGSVFGEIVCNSDDKRLLSRLAAFASWFGHGVYSAGRFFPSQSTIADRSRCLNRECSQGGSQSIINRGWLSWREARYVSICHSGSNLRP